MSTQSYRSALLIIYNNDFGDVVRYSISLTALHAGYKQFMFVQ